jgi:hypothetical protein
MPMSACYGPIPRTRHIREQERSFFLVHKPWFFCKRVSAHQLQCVTHVRASGDGERSTTQTMMMQMSLPCHPWRRGAAIDALHWTRTSPQTVRVEMHHRVYVCIPGDSDEYATEQTEQSRPFERMACWKLYLFQWGPASCAGRLRVGCYCEMQRATDEFITFSTDTFGYGHGVGDSFYIPDSLDRSNQTTWMHRYLRVWGASPS